MILVALSFLVITGSSIEPLRARGVVRNGMMILKAQLGSPATELKLCIDTGRSNVLFALDTLPDSNTREAYTELFRFDADSPAVRLPFEMSPYHMVRGLCDGLLGLGNASPLWLFYDTLHIGDGKFEMTNYDKSDTYASTKSRWLTCCNHTNLGVASQPSIVIEANVGGSLNPIAILAYGMYYLGLDPIRMSDYMHGMLSPIAEISCPSQTIDIGEVAAAGAKNVYGTVVSYPAVLGGELMRRCDIHVYGLDGIVNVCCDKTSSTTLSKLSVVFGIVSLVFIALAWTEAINTILLSLLTLPIQILTFSFGILSGPPVRAGPVGGTAFGESSLWRQNLAVMVGFFAIIVQIFHILTYDHRWNTNGIAKIRKPHIHSDATFGQTIVEFSLITGIWVGFASVHGFVGSLIDVFLALAIVLRCSVALFDLVSLQNSGTFRILVVLILVVHSFVFAAFGANVSLFDTFINYGRTTSILLGTILTISVFDVSLILWRRRRWILKKTSVTKPNSFTYPKQ